MTSTSLSVLIYGLGSGSQNKATIVLWQVEIIVSQVMHPEVKTPKNKITKCLVNLYVNSLIMKKKTLPYKFDLCKLDTMALKV